MFIYKKINIYFKKNSNYFYFFIYLASYCNYNVNRELINF